MLQQSSKSIKRLILLSLLSSSLCSALPAKADEPAESTLVSAADRELLLFWEEKELYVQTATRSEKPLTQVAENMTVVTAREIEAMNANSVAEVLARVPGLFVNFSTNEYVSGAQIGIQGSDSRHVTILLDGMPINFLSGGNAETSFIPLRIVERIEIIKGAASSSWGSGLGGVINIITRSTGDSSTPNGLLSSSYGEGNSRDLGGELRGKNGPLGYYLYAGQQASDGLRNNRDFRRNSIFGKLLLTPNRDLDIIVSAGLSNPKFNDGEVPAAFVSSQSKLNTHFINSSFEYRVKPELTFRGGLHFFKSSFDQPAFFLLSFAPSPGQLRIQNIYDEQTIGANLRGTWTSGIQTLTLGVEGSHGKLEQNTNAGPLFQAGGFPPTVQINSSVDRWGIFANDTIEAGPFSVTPGIRLDHDNITGYFVSPSLGLTWEAGEHTVVRASAARGFSSPPLSYTAGGGPYFTANSGLKAERGWSYQAGLEAGLASLVNLKATLFRHDMTNAITQLPVTPTTVINQGDITRQGYELEAESVPLHNLSLKLGHSYSHVKGESIQSGYASPSYDNYAWLVGIRYDDRRNFSAQLNGSYVWWDRVGTPPPRYSTFIWDLTATRKFRLSNNTVLEGFLTIHNLFSGHYYTSGFYPNPPRWVEGGLRFKF
jgi:vitamin B12 transporter